MSTVLQIITEAMQDLGVIAIDETPTATEAALCLSKFQDMIDTWQTESLSIFTIQPYVFPFSNGSGPKISYTLGVGGDFNLTFLPQKIQMITILDPTGTTDYPCDMLSAQEYASIQVKNISTSLPYQCYNDNNYPLRTLYFYPVPSDGTWSAKLWLWQALNPATALTTNMLFPPGYSEAFKTNLGVRLGPRFGRPVSADLQTQATTFKARIQRANTVIPEMRVDKRLTHKQGYNQQDFYAGK